MRTLTPRERRLVAVGILALTLAAVWFAVVAPLIAGAQARAAEREALRQTWSRDERLLVSAPVWRAEVARQRRDAGRFTLVAPTRAEAEDQLRRRVAAAFEASGAHPSSVEALRAGGSPARVTVRADVSASLAQLSAALRQIEDAEPFTVVDYLSVSADAAFRTGRPGPLAIRLEVTADTARGAHGRS